MIKTSWSKISLLFFFVIAFFGSIMRLPSFSTALVNYNHLLHSHSHVAFQGWIYTTLFLLISKLYVDDVILSEKRYSLQFKLTVVIILGIMVSFLFQGYAVFSILFSSLFQVLNYWFAFRFFKDIKSSKKSIQHSFSLKFIKIGFWLMILSTAGPWVVGILSAKGLNATEYYHSALYFFLHFQYNGWFTFAILGIFFFLLEKHNINFLRKEAQLFYVLFTTAIVPSYFLSLLGMSFRNYIIAFGYISAALQLISLFYLIKLISNKIKEIKKVTNNYTYFVLSLAFFSLTLKIILQLISVFPSFEVLAFNNRFIIISFIHLVMIGFISFFLLGSLFHLGWYNLNSYLNKTGVFFLVIGFIVSEIILVGIALNYSLINNQMLLFIFSAFMALGILLILIGQLLNTQSKL